MNVLLDTCVSRAAIAIIKKAGHEVDWVGRGKDPGDEAIVAIAYERRSILVTLDKDFGELVVSKGVKHNGIIRMVGFRATQQGEVAVRILKKYNDDLLNHALITVTPTRTRIRFTDVQ